MSCLVCASVNQAEFAAEVNVHFPGLKNLDKPSVFVFPKLLVCLDCGISQFATPKTELAILARGSVALEDSRRSRVLATSHTISGILTRPDTDL
jgi:hypothetical protein